MRGYLEKRRAGAKHGLAALIRSDWSPVFAVFASGKLSIYAGEDCVKTLIAPISIGEAHVRQVASKSGKTQFEVLVAVPNGHVTHVFRSPDASLFLSICAYCQMIEAQVIAFARTHNVGLYACGWVLCMHVARALKRYQQQTAGLKGKDLVSVPWLHWFVVLSETTLRFFNHVPVKLADLRSGGTGYSLFGTAVQALDEKKSMGEPFAFGFYACNGTVLCMRAADKEGQLRWAEVIRRTIIAQLKEKLASLRPAIVFPACSQLPIEGAPAAPVPADRANRALMLTAKGVWLVAAEHQRALEDAISAGTAGDGEGVAGLVFFHRYTELRVLRVVNETTLAFDFGRYGEAAVLDLHRPMASVKFIIADLVRLCRAP